MQVPSARTKHSSTLGPWSTVAHPNSPPNCSPTNRQRFYTPSADKGAGIRNERVAAKPRRAQPACRGAEIVTNAGWGRWKNVDFFRVSRRREPGPVTSFHLSRSLARSDRRHPVSCPGEQTTCVDKGEARAQEVADVSSSHFNSM